MTPASAITIIRHIPLDAEAAAALCYCEYEQFA